MNKYKFMKEVEVFLNNNKNLKKEDFKNLWELATNGKNDNNFCDELIKKMFGIYKEILIPWSFLDSEIGKAIIQVKYGKSSGIYFVREIAEGLDKSRQYINQEIKFGNLKGYKRCGNSIVYKEDLKDYIVKRGLDDKVLYKETEEKIIIPTKEREEKYGGN